jgi:KTSC domain
MLYADLFDSKAIAMFAYDVAGKRLLIHFKTGGVYAYQDVPRAVFDGFREARSKGGFFQSAIRDRFAGRRLSPGEVADLEQLPSPRGPGIADGVRVDISSLERPSKASVFF